MTLNILEVTDNSVTSAIFSTTFGQALMNSYHSTPWIVYNTEANFLPYIAM